MSKRSQLVQTALALFYRQGIHATGVEQIARDSGVTKKTLYSHFASKEELVLAALRLRDEQFRSRLERTLQALPPAERAAGYIEFLLAWAAEASFCGCAFINAAAEYAPHHDPIHRLAAEHKRLVREFLERVLGQAGLAQHAQAAAELFLLGEGVIVAGQVGGLDDLAGPARAAAGALLARYR